METPQVIGFSIEITYSFSCGLSNDFSECFVTEIHGDIRARYDDSKVRDIGLVCAEYIDLATAMTEHADLAEVLDTTQTIANYTSALYNPKTLDFKRSVTRMFDGEPMLSNLLILDRLEIAPEFRGKRIGLAVLYKTMQHFARDCGLVAMKPFPLQFEARFKNETARYELLKLGSFSSNQRSATKALTKYYQALGFRKLSGTPYHLLCPALKNPTMSDLDLPENGY